MADSLKAAKVQAEFCNLPHESRTGVLLAATTTVYAVVCVSVLLRFASKFLTSQVRLDDWLFLAAFSFTTVTYVSSVESKYVFASYEVFN